MAGVEGVEPSSGVLETLILPMNYTPKRKEYNKQQQTCQLNNPQII